MSADIRTCDDFNLTPGTAGASPEQKLLTSPADSSPSSVTSSSPGLDPISPHTTQYTLSPSPVTTKDSAPRDDASPSASLAILCCDLCPFVVPDCDVAGFVMHIKKEHHPHGSTQLWCGRKTCKSTCRDVRSLERHIRSYHLDKCYICRCRYRNARKDKYSNHLNKCKVEVPPGSLYKCICGQQFDGDTREGSNKEYRDHIDKCGTLTKGRKRKHGA